MMEILSVAVGGALGAVCRYLLGNFISRMSGSAFLGEPLPLIL